MKNLFSLFFIFILYCFYGCNSHISDKTGYIVFAASYFDITEIDKTNAAVLITDKDSIKYFEDLFFDNPFVSMCPCGYNYRIHFFDENGNSIWNEMYYPSNRYTHSNDEIKNIVDSLAFRLHNRPSHYIYNIMIDVCPEIAINELKAEGYFPLIMTDSEFEKQKTQEYYTIQVLYSDNLEGLKENLESFSFIIKIERAIEKLSLNI